MNLRNHKRAVIGGLCAILLLIEVGFLILAHAGLSGQKRVLEQSQRRLSQLHRRSPFPSKENREALQERLERLEYRVGELTAAVVRDPFPQDAVEAADFSARAQGVIERFQKRAGQSGVFLPASIEVGFSQYASGGSVPLPAHVPRLSRQLYSVERVAEVLIGSGVDSIDQLTRDLFEVEKSTDREPSRRRRPRHDASASPVQRAAHLVATEVHPDYYIERVGVSFSAKEEGVWRVLDRLASAPHFMVVSEFSHTTGSDILSYNPEAVKRGGEDETRRYLADGILVGEKALSRPERMIAGNEVVQIRLVVMVYNFEPEVPGQ